jgi:hypothetical protein
MVGVDPERRDLISCAWKDEAGVATFSRFIITEYQEKVDLRKRRRNAEGGRRKKRPRDGIGRAA